MNLRGKTREQLEAALAHKSRLELIDLIFSLVTVEQLLKPAEIAKSAHGNFTPIGPCPVLVALKKKRFEPCSNSKPSAPGLSGELTSNHR
jgi:hypothetical protein